MSAGSSQSTRFTLAGLLPGSSFEFLCSDQVLKRDGKRPANPTAGWGALAACVFAVVPIYIGVTVWVLLPLTIASAVYQKVAGSTGAPSPSPPRPARLVGGSAAVDAEPRRGDREWDLVVLGATGYTGGLAVEHLAKSYGPKSASSLRWAVAGRSAAKLAERRAEICELLKDPGALDGVGEVHLRLRKHAAYIRDAAFN